MLGEKIGEGSGKVTARRVLATGPVPRIEISFEERGRVLGLDTRGIATYWSEPRGPGSFYGEGHGVMMGPDGESAAWTGGGVGRARGDGGAVSYRGSLYYSAPPGSKLARLNGVAVIFEFEVDEEGNTKGGLWEWK